MGRAPTARPLADHRVRRAFERFGLDGRTVYLPQMPYAGSFLLAAAFRSAGVDAQVTADSDDHSLELGARVTSGDECYPQKITVGDFLRVLEERDPQEVAFFMPAAAGPCRFGQYHNLIRRALAEMGYRDVPVVTLTTADGYRSFGWQARDAIRAAWWAMVAHDALLKMLLRIRPFERQTGSADAAHLAGVEDVAAAVALQGASAHERLRAVTTALVQARDRLRAVSVRINSSRPLIGIVGEIFCRLNTFSNDDLVRVVEQQGGECWVSGVTEWVWYTDMAHRTRLAADGRLWSVENAKRYGKALVQRSDEHALLEPFREDFVGYEEAHDIREVVESCYRYLPYTGVQGEMVVSAGAAIHLYRKGADGIIDISPFTCMNGIVTEAIYPVVQRDCDGIPIRTFYFDGTQSDLERDVGIFLELAHTYQRRKKIPRRYPACFARAAT